MAKNDRPGPRQQSQVPPAKTRTVAPPAKTGNTIAPAKGSMTPPRPSQLPPAPEGLDEVERALSVLGGRHPDAVRAERETRAAAEARQAVLKEAASEESRESLKRAAKIAGMVVILGAIGAAAFYVQSRHHAVEAHVAPLAAAYTSRGFSTLAAPSWPMQSKLEANVESPSCLVAISDAVGAQSLSIQHGDTHAKGETSIAWCSCGSEHITVTAEKGGAVRLLNIDAIAIGGAKGLPLFDPQPKTILKPVNDDCAGDVFDAWVNDHKYPPFRPSEKWFDEGARAMLKLAGFHVVASATPRAPFVVVEPSPQSCFLAVPSGDGKLSLRLQGGNIPIANASGPIAWCDSGAHTQTILRDGPPGGVSVVAAPVDRVGGLLGTIEWAHRAGLGDAKGWERDEDLGWNSLQTLRASGLPDAQTTIGSQVGKPVAEPRLLAISLASGGVLKGEPRPGVSFACDPPLSPSPVNSTCAQLGPVNWLPRSGPTLVGAAASPIPFWLRVLNGITDPDLAKAEIDLMLLARRLHAEGFEPTTLEALTELAEGVEVLGAAGGDAVVAVGIGPKPPYVFPYSDGPAWTITGEPRIVPLKAGELVILRAPHTPTVPKDQRRTVAFRRTISK